MSSPAAIETSGLGKRFGSTWALRNCSVTIPRDRVTALAARNGPGKTTLLHLAVGLTAPNAGSVQVLGACPRRDAATLLPRIGIVAQDHPLFRGFTIAEFLRVG